MSETLLPFLPTIYASFGVVFLFMLQSMVGIVSRIKSGQGGGEPITGGHERWLFRVDRARANTIEVIGVYSLLITLALAVQKNSQPINVAATVFFVARLLHMIFYYANIPRLRSLSFFASVVPMMVILINIGRGLFL